MSTEKPPSSKLADHLALAKEAGVFHLMREPYEIERAARAAGLAVCRLDIGHAHDKMDFLKLVAKGLQFPDWFGGNWDALHDCLTDLEWLGDAHRGYAIVFEKSKHFAAGHKQEFEQSMEVLAAAADYWREKGRPFWAFVHGAQGWKSGLTEWPAS